MRELAVDSSAPAPMADDIPMERHLARRALAGDTRAFRLIYERHAAPIYRFLRDILRDDAAADEATQETFVRAHTRLSTLADRDKLAPWLFGIARLVSFELLRARKAADLAVDETELEAAHSPAPTPEAALLGREADAALASALAALPAERRAALLLQMDHDLSYDEIAGAMGWSLSKVKIEIHRARLALRDRLKEYVGCKA